MLGLLAIPVCEWEKKYTDNKLFYKIIYWDVDMFWCLVCDIPHSTSPCTGHCPLLHTYTPYTLCTSRFEFSCLRGGLCGNKKAKVASNTSLPTLARIMLAERGDFHWQQKNERNSPIHWESDRGQGSPWVTGGRDIPCSPQQEMAVLGT